jgi:glycolate oxidase
MNTSDRSLTRAQIRFLQGLFPGDRCLLGPEECLIFGTDSSRLFAAPWAVVRPAGTDTISELLRWADRERVPVIPRCRGTNMVGGCVPGQGGVVLSLLEMDRVLEISPSDFLAVAQPGVVTGHLQDRAAEQRLFYPPDPASVRFSTIGGNVATNAGGMRAVKYGVTREYVLGLEVVLPGGEVIRTGGRCHKDVVGLDLTGLMVGSEGTLGVITAATLKLLPLPEASGSLLLAFKTMDEAVGAGETLLQASILPAALELMAGEVLTAIEAVSEVPWPGGAEAVLLIKLDGSTEGVAADLHRTEEVLRGSEPLLILRGTGEAEKGLWELRRLVSPASFKLRPDKMSEDVAVPRGKVRPLLSGIRAIAAEAGLPILTFGHIGDGNIHTNIMFDGALPLDRQHAASARERVLGLVLSLGGTLSGEHGVGMAKLGAAAGQLGEAQVRLMQGIKRVFDPHGIMNPGKAY